MIPKPNTIFLLDKTYTPEEVCDVDRDVSECWDNPEIPTDESGFAQGEYKITVTFHPYQA